MSEKGAGGEEGGRDDWESRRAGVGRDGVAAAGGDDPTARAGDLARLLRRGVCCWDMEGMKGADQGRVQSRLFIFGGL